VPIARLQKPLFVVEVEKLRRAATEAHRRAQNSYSSKGSCDERVSAR
jgi:hypothetical protein